MKSTLQSIARTLGYDIFKRDVRFHPELCAANMAAVGKFKTLLDVGANVGQYAKGLRDWGYHGEIVSFEPLTQAHRELSAAAAADSAWKVAPRCALGSARADSKINISAKSACSSLLEMNETHKIVVPGSDYAGSEAVEIRTLDEMIGEVCKPQGPFYLKIDTQGYEKEVLGGAPETLARCAAVQMELSLTPLYEGGFLFQEGLEWMWNRGFRVFAIYPGVTDRTTGENLQVDVVFVRGTGESPGLGGTSISI